MKDKEITSYVIQTCQRFTAALRDYLEKQHLELVKALAYEKQKIMRLEQVILDAGLELPVLPVLDVTRGVSDIQGSPGATTATVTKYEPATEKPGEFILQQVEASSYAEAIPLALEKFGGENSTLHVKDLAKHVGAAHPHDISSTLSRLRKQGVIHNKGLGYWQLMKKEEKE